MSANATDFEKKLNTLAETASRRSEKPDDFAGIFMYLLTQELFPNRKIDTLEDFRKSTENLPGEVSFKHVISMLDAGVGVDVSADDLKSIARGLQGIVLQLNDVIEGK